MDASKLQAEQEKADVAVTVAEKAVETAKLNNATPAEIAKAQKNLADAKAAADKIHGASAPADATSKKAVSEAHSGLQQQMNHIATLREYLLRGNPITLAQLDALRDRLDAVSQSLTSLP